MNAFREKLSRRICEGDIHEFAALAQGLDDNPARTALYYLLFDTNKRVSDNAAWIFTHFDLYSNTWLYDKRDALIDEVMCTASTTKRRLLLTLLLRQPFSASALRTDFVDFCLKSILSVEEPVAVKAVCMKLAYRQCRFFPELLSELKETLEIMEPDLLSPGLRTARKNILQAIRKCSSKD